MFDTNFLDSGGSGSSSSSSSAQDASSSADTSSALPANAAAAGASTESTSTDFSSNNAAALEGAFFEETSFNDNPQQDGADETDSAFSVAVDQPTNDENSSLETRPEEEENPGDEAISEEEELARYAADPSTPAFARKQIERAMQLAGRIKADLADRDLKLNELETKFQSYEGKEVLPASDIERMKAAEEAIFSLQSFAAAPEDIDRVIQELNPSLHQEYQRDLVIKALERSDGTPDFDNIQVVVDRWMGGEEGSVDAKLLFQAAEALKKGIIQPEQLHEFGSREEFEQYQLRQAAEREISEAKRATTEHLKYQETQVRQGELTQVVRAVQTQIEKPVMQLFDKFKMAKIDNEPKISSEFKDEVNRKISQIINNAPEQVREIGAVFKAIEKLTQPTGKKAPEIAAEIRAFAQSPAFNQHVNKGISELMSQIEKTIAREAYRYRLMMKGYEADNSRPDNARAVIGNPSQSANLPNMTAEQLNRMSARERNEKAMEHASRKLRSPQVNRYGG